MFGDDGQHGFKYLIYRGVILAPNSPEAMWRGETHPHLLHFIAVHDSVGSLVFGITTPCSYSSRCRLNRYN